MTNVTRIHLKTLAQDRSKLIDFCLHGKEQCVAIGWSGIHKDNAAIHDFKDFYEAVRALPGRLKPVLNIFKNTAVGDLFWTRDLDGNYWICRAIETAQIKYLPDMDIGAIVPVKAYKVGMQVPGQIKASFNHANSGTAAKIKGEVIHNFSKYIFNKCSLTPTYTYDKLPGSVLDNLPDLDLEELVIAYLQIKKNYYVLSNSIAKKSTTVKIECELMGRDLNKREKAVVQVKGGNNKTLDALDYQKYAEAGYNVFLYAPYVINLDKVANCIEITREELTAFYDTYKLILPESITRWEDLFS